MGVVGEIFSWILRDWEKVGFGKVLEGFGRMGIWGFLIDYLQFTTISFHSNETNQITLIHRKNLKTLTCLILSTNSEISPNQKNHLNQAQDQMKSSKTKSKLN
jgi:hypothetical protein